MNKIIYPFFSVLLACTGALAQEKIVDRVVGVVGNSIIMQSELEANIMQMNIMQNNGAPVGDKSCKALEDLLFQKLLLAQAQRDSLNVTEAQIEQEMDRRMNYYIKQFGSEEKFVQFYGKSVDNFKSDLKDNVRDLLLAQQMQSKITTDINVTPSEVKNFYSNIPKDSLEFINTEIEVAQIVKKPKVTAEAKKEAKNRIEEIRARILKGESSFSTMAALYSQDPGSANKGGLYERIPRGQFVPEWDAWAFKLKPNEISEVFETVYGYFIVQLIERRGDEVDARSLLISPKIEQSDLFTAKYALDSIYDKIKTDSMKFTVAAAKFSDDEDSKNNGGLMVNPFSSSTKFDMNEIGQIDQNVAFAIDKLEVGDITKPMPFTTNDGKQAYRIVYLKSRNAPHKLNLTDDYQRIQAMALAKKQQEAVSSWIKRKAGDTYVRVDADFKTCNFSNKWVN